MRTWMMLGLLGCTGKEAVDTSGDTSAVDWASLDVTAAGPFQVGHTVVEHTYTAFDGDAPRTITVNVWYPTDDDGGFDAEYVLGVDEDAIADAAPAAPIHDSGYPVHLYSHGFRAFGGDAAPTMRHFASHGWVAVAPDHVGNLITDHVDPLYTAHYIHKLRDLQESLDVAEGLALAGPVDTSAVLLSGHSFGASYSTWGAAGAAFDQVAQSCADESFYAGGCTDAELAAFTSGALDDDRVAAIVPLAGSVREAFFGTTGYASVEAPVLKMAGTEDNPESAQAEWENTPDVSMVYVMLEGGCHLSFTTGACTTLDREVALEVVRSYTLAFGRKHILGDGTHDSLLDASEQPWPEAVTQAR